MLLNSPLDVPLFEGTGTSSLVPGVYLVAIDSRPYVVDFSVDTRRDEFRHRSIPLLRPQADTSNLPGEGSLNPAALWRRSVESWHKGAGQVYFDRTDSDSDRFRSSKGVDVWTRWQLTLLPATGSRLSSANTNLYMAVAGSDIYICDGTALKFTANITTASPSYTTVTGTGAAAPTSIASDGYNVWTAHAANGLYTTTRGAAAATQLVTSALSANSVVGYVKGRLMLSKDNAVYNITSTAPAVLPAALMTQANTDFVWVAFAEGPNSIYMAGYSGDKSLIYRTAVVADATSLAAPTVAGELPDGEIVRSIQGYLGFLVIGTDTGFRLAEIDSNGNLNIGARVATASPVRCFEPQDRFVWYGLTNYDASSTGLGRMDLSVLNDTAPAYASDLMVAGQGTVQAVVTFQNVRVLSVSGLGVYVETTDKLASGTLDSGLISFGISDPKVPVFLDVTTAPLVGSYVSSLALEGGTFDQVGTSSTAGSVTGEYPLPQTMAHNFELRVELDRSGSDSTTGPTFYRQTLRANPTSRSGFDILVPVRLHETVLVGDAEYDLVPSVELAALDELRTSRRVVTYQEGGQSYAVTVENLDWIPESIGRTGTELNGCLVVHLKSLA